MQFQDNDFFNQVANNIDEIAGWNNYLMLGEYILELKET